ncbi:hypothetical protein BX600DRAFT_436588 [Xylariales sp. PMI_506]|nr:hypothetical protein BX600DRAFT_436588 [Xylariales sp. PMI_506]
MSDSGAIDGDDGPTVETAESSPDVSNQITPSRRLTDTEYGSGNEIARSSPNYSVTHESPVTTVNLTANGYYGRQVSDPTTSTSASLPRRSTSEVVLRLNRRGREGINAQRPLQSTHSRPGQRGGGVPARQVRLPLSELDPTSIPLPLRWSQQLPSTNQGRSYGYREALAGIPRSVESWQRSRRRGSLSSLSSSSYFEANSQPSPRNDTMAQLVDSVSGNEVDLLFSSSTHTRIFRETINISTPSSAWALSSSRNATQIRFIYVGTATGVLTGRQVWATLHREDRYGLEFWVDNPVRPLREVVLLTGNRGLHSARYDTVELGDIELSRHVAGMTKEQLITWLRRLFLMRPGVSDSWFLFG